MVTRDYMARSARHWFRREGTALARAMLRALGLPHAGGGRNSRRTSARRGYTEASEIMECFENRGTPMDGRITA
ncbi:hypothetical protein [uncultured Adlercreutzia sp.]|uniref:hypothetical protein n=1 Tax=uncultured Adlercreutzia sp. TaxID=875803 RepID=UPI0025A63B79|nr:hypothetical protein [uncultured Adlercreutzia sp.]